MLKVLNSHPPDYHYKNITSQMAFKILNLQVITFKIEKEKKKKNAQPETFKSVEVQGLNIPDTRNWKHKNK